jgi:iron complex outermembrane receptor protein
MKHNDFGAANVWKLSSSVNAIEDDKLTFRGSVSTGFRAPSLHKQINISKVEQLL